MLIYGSVCILMPELPLEEYIIIFVAVANNTLDQKWS